MFGFFKFINHYGPGSRPRLVVLGLRVNMRAGSRAVPQSFTNINYRLVFCLWKPGCHLVAPWPFMP